MITDVTGIRKGMQSALRLLLPATCLVCDVPVETEQGLCGTCWRDTPFISGMVCDTCGMPLPGDDTGQLEHCDDCLTMARPWDRGRAALIYKDHARGLVLSLKHGDRLDLAVAAAAWMHRAAGPLLTPQTLVAPVPLHWLRLIRRRYNQSALLGAAIAKAAKLDWCPDLLKRARPTPSQDHRDRDGRFANVAGSIQPHPRQGVRIKGRRILLVDDVMTSGATFAAATEACLAAGAAGVCVVAMARVAKDT
jgi:predicted amidophosphoribosyltransferase